MENNQIIDFFSEVEHDGFKYTNEIGIKKGSNNVLISAPHAYWHKRQNQTKERDSYTYSIAQILAASTESHVICLSKSIDYDPNYDEDNNYYNTVLDYIKNNEIEYYIDLHGMLENDDSDFDIGINKYKNVNNDKDLIKEIVAILNENGIKKSTVDKLFKSSKRSLCYKINQEMKIKTIQFEISRKYRKIKKDEEKAADLLNGLIDIIRYIENRGHYKQMTYKDKLSKKDDIKDNYYNKEGSKVFNYAKKFDKILDVKPLFGYTRKLKEKIEYTEVGLELEVSVTLERDKYTLIKKLLKNIKDTVGTNGFFVKDATILGDYGFEIVLDPLNTKQIYEVYSRLKEIFDFSNGLIGISKAKNCGIHMNFNKYDVTDLNESHKRLTSLLTEKNKFFEENIYKQGKFIWNFAKYCEFQSKISNKYVWVNYLDSKVVEVRNIRTDLNPIEMVKLIELILNALFCDKLNKSFDYQNYITLSKIYDTALNKNQSDEIFNSINNNSFVLLSFKDGIAKLVDLDDEIIKLLKEVD